jgi:hypothetical protein
MVIVMDSENNHNTDSKTENSSEVHDLAYKVTSYLELAVSLIRDKSTKPLAGLVNAVSVLIMLVASLFLLLALAIIGGVRLLNNLVFSGHIWASYLTLGGIFFIAGMLLMKKVVKERSKVA